MDLKKRVEELSAGRREANEKLVKLQTYLDRELATWQGQEGELDRLREELKEWEFTLRELTTVRGELGKRTSELEKKDFELQKRSSEREKKDSELQSALKDLSVVCQLAEDAKVKHDCERIAFQHEKKVCFAT